VEQRSSDKYTIAWFKLAQCIVSGQKERALGIYRLLAHSLNDKALVHQLEGDIFLSFHDNEPAAAAYLHAAKTYQQDNRLFEAALIFDHLTVLQPQLMGHGQKAIEIYTKLNKPDTAHQRLNALCAELIAKQEWEQCLQLIGSLPKELDDLGNTFLTKLILLLAEQPSSASLEKTMKKGIDQTLEKLNNPVHEVQLQEFLQELAAKEPIWHEYAQAQLAKSKQNVI